MLKLQPHEHMVRETHLTDWLRREFPHLPLGTMFNASAGVWEVIELHPGGWASELCIIGPYVAMFSTKHVHDLRRRLQYDPSRFREGREAVRSNFNQRRLDETAQRAAFKDWINWYRRHNHCEDDMLLRAWGGVGYGNA